MIYTDLTKKALVLSFQKHKEQLDKSGMPYIFHPFIVASEMKSEEMVCVALLHDVLEDTDTSQEELKALGFTQEIIDAIVAMRRKRDEDYFDYIMRVKSNPISREVKKADLKHNSDLTRFDEITPRDLERQEKYLKAIKIMNEE